MNEKMNAPAGNQGTQNTTNNDNDITLMDVQYKEFSDALKVKNKIRDMDEYLERLSYEVAAS